MTNPPPNAPAAIIAAIIVLRSIGILLYLPFGPAMKPAGEGFPSAHQELLPLKAAVMARRANQGRVYRVNGNRSEGLTDLPHAPALAAGHCESVMKDPRKAHQWRNVLVLQAAVAALFLPFVISLAMMILLAGHDDPPIRPVDRIMTSSTR